MPDNLSYREFLLQRRTNRLLLGVNSIYYLLTGLWPIVHINSFMEISGYKTDIWLVRTVGVLILCIGLSQLRELLLRNYSSAIAFLSLVAASALFAIDTYYSLNHIISRIYLVDGIIQFLLAGFWTAFMIRSRRRQGS